MKTRDKKTARLILRAFGILCILYGIGLQIYHAGAGLEPAWLGAGAICLGLSLKKPYDLVFSKKWIRTLLTVCFVLFMIFEGIIIVTGHGVAPEEIDVVIVFGAKVNGETPSRTLQYRLETALQYLTAHGGTKAILSGGQGSNEGISEAEAMYRYLTARGIDGARLILEDQSTSTYENLLNSFNLLGDDKSLRICVITSDYHVLRAMLISARLGRQVDGIGSETSVLMIPNYYIRELFGVVYDLIRPIRN